MKNIEKTKLHIYLCVFAGEKIQYQVYLHESKKKNSTYQNLKILKNLNTPISDRIKVQRCFCQHESNKTFFNGLYKRLNTFGHL